MLHTSATLASTSRLTINFSKNGMEKHKISKSKAGISGCTSRILGSFHVDKEIGADCIVTDMSGIGVVPRE